MLVICLAFLFAIAVALAAHLFYCNGIEMNLIHGHPLGNELHYTYRSWSIKSSV